MPGSTHTFPTPSGVAESDLETSELTNRNTVQVQLSFCQLWVIVNEVRLVHRNEETGQAPLAFALSKYRELLQLAERLPKFMIRTDRTTNVALVMQ